MMRATRVVVYHDTGEVHAAGPRTGDEERCVREGVDELDIVAGDDVRVRSRGDRTIAEPLSDHPLLLRRLPDESGTVRVWTEFEPDAEVAVGGVKRGQPVRPGRE